MNNTIDYYYSLQPDELIFRNEKYFFDCENKSYVLEKVSRPITDIEALYNLNKVMIERNILVHKIILNKENSVISYIDNKPYILMEIFINKDARINLSDLCYINNSSFLIKYDNILDRHNWIKLWETKNDYFEQQINELGKKYPNLCTYANYYIGLAENAISYMKKVGEIKEDTFISVCSKRIDAESDLFSLYNPLNFICDYRVRDACEYIKSCFFNNKEALDLVKKYFENNYLSYKEALLFFARLLYPSYFFDLYDDIVNKELNENIIDKVTNKTYEYELFLKEVYFFLSNLYRKYIPCIDWIIKRSLF